MVLAAYLTTAFVVGATGAWHLLRERSNEAARSMFSMAMWMAALVAPLQILAGDLHGLNTLEHQPAKIAAIEGHWETQRGAPLYLVGMPDMQDEITRGIAVPRLGSLILTHDWDGEIRGLKSWPREDRPHAPTVFWSFRVMVGIGTLMLLTGLASLYLRLRRTLFEHRAFLRSVVWLGPSGFVAVLAGWITTESGRQPYVVYGLMRTLEARSPIDAPAVAGSLVAFVLVYFIVFGAGVYYLLKLMQRAPQPLEPEPDPHLPQRAAGITPAPALEAK
jgi:cytochrome d ubiquinol oxidase subunit I